MKKIKSKQNQKRSRGFTLVEAMLSVAISSMIAYSIFTVMRAGETQQEGIRVKMTIQDSAREGLYKMAQEIRLSAPDRITINGGGDSIQFDIPDPSNPVEADYTVNWTGAHSIQYELGGDDGDQIIRTDLTSGQTSVIANDVTGLNFTGNSAEPDLVTITMGVQRTMTNNRQIPETPLQLTGQAEIRNA